MDLWLFCVVFLNIYCVTIVFVSPEWPPPATLNCKTNACVCVCTCIKNMLVVVIKKKDERKTEMCWNTWLGSKCEPRGQNYSGLIRRVCVSWELSADLQQKNTPKRKKKKGLMWFDWIFFQILATIKHRFPHRSTQLQREKETSLSKFCRVSMWAKTLTGEMAVTQTRTESSVTWRAAEDVCGLRSCLGSSCCSASMASPGSAVVQLISM